MVNTIQPRCTHKDCSFYGKCLEDNVLMRICAEGGIHKEDYYWLTGEILTEEQFLQDCADDGLFMIPEKKKVLWAMGDEPERKPRRFGYGSTAEGPDEVNL